MIHEELRKPGVTLMLLWEEYRSAHPHDFAYSWFCAHYRTWDGQLDRVMRQTHRAGEKLFADRVLENLRAVQGLLRLKDKYGAARLEAACDQALAYDNPATAP